MEKDMTKGKPWRLILFFSLPLMAGNIFQQLYSMVDTIIVGKFVGVNALAAVGSTGAIFFLVIGFVMGMTSGFAVVTAQRFGAKDEKGVRRSVGTSILLSIFMTIIVTVLSVATAKPLLTLMNTPAEIYQDAYTYIVIIYLGCGAAVYYNMISSILRSLGDSKTPLYFLLVSSGLNVVLDLVLIIYANMGVAGAAYATVISQLVSAVLCTIYTAKRYQILKLSRDDLRFDAHNAAVHLKLGVPMALQFSVTAVGVMVVQGALNVFGPTVIAAYTAGCKVEMLVVQPFNAFGSTMATFCGQNLGAGRMDRIKKGMKSCALICFVFCMIASLLNVFCGGYFTMLFVEKGETLVFTYAQQYLNIIAVFYIPLALILVLRNALQGMGEVLFPMLGGIGELAARFVAALILPGFLGYVGICLASPVAWVITGLLLLGRYLWIMKDVRTA